MTEWLFYLIIAPLGYCLGCLPSGLWIGRYFYSLDITEHGSKNIGATNLFREHGPKPALAVLLLDMGKGFIAVWIAKNVAPGDDFALLLGGVAAILGHTYSVFVNFKGGRGVATGLGVILFLMPAVTLVVFILWAALVYSTRYVSLASVAAALCVPVLAWWFSYPALFVIFSAAAAVFITARHRENIIRLLSGRETPIRPGGKK
jgi:glycerol-3-phosphate acyltransferase PlsY